MYADYKYYIQDFKGGVIPSAKDFLTAEANAGRYIEHVTHRRVVGNVTDDVRNAVCAIAEIEYQTKVRNSKNGIVSESNDGVSKSYAQETSESVKLTENKKYSFAMQYLGHTGLMYRGV
ncbi:MAG: hypothetical protein IJ279_04185 [Clostridia bacterium]|nr:hypothetical protein [Clostridia bacterium]